jgi:hypothetical protein
MTMVARLQNPVQLLLEHCRSFDRIEFHVDGASLMQLISTMQLSLRHLGFVASPVGANMRVLCDQLIVAFSKGDAQIEALMRQGDDPSQDVSDLDVAKDLARPSPNPES